MTYRQRHFPSSCQDSANLANQIKFQTNSGKMSKFKSTQCHSFLSPLSILEIHDDLQSENVSKHGVVKCLQKEILLGGRLVVCGG